jgi:hypothetical protein
VAALSILVSIMIRLVYLDSSDFSNLSRPDAQLSHENRTILAALRQHKRAGTADFFMSVVHLSETVHAADEHKEAALRRAELMRELCGSNMLRLPTDIPKLELEKAVAGATTARLAIDELRSAPGEWFGVDLPLDRMSDNRANIRRQLDSHFETLPRRERRKRRSQLDFRKRSAKEKWRELLKSGARTTRAPYPFTLIEQDTVISWFLGEISDAEFRRETIQLMHDPYIMFKYLVDATGHRNTLYNSLRKQGREIADVAAESDRKLIGAMLPFAKNDVAPDLKAMVARFFADRSTLRRIVSSFGASTAEIADVNLTKAIKACPSLFMFTELYKSILLSRIRSYFSRIRAGKIAPKRPEPSDFGDIMHCYYAPYFDVFRCDARFGAQLKQHAPIRARIADRISDLPRMLTAPMGHSCEVA